jgi:hypothetical protein
MKGLTIISIPVYIDKEEIFQNTIGGKAHG